MKVSYTLTSDEYVESEYAYRVRMAKGRVLFRNLYGLACIAAFLGIYLLFSGFRWWAFVLFLVAAVLLVERAVFWRIRAQAMYRSTPNLGEPIELKIEESNLVLMSSARNREIRWANISACHETKNLFVLGVSHHDLLVIPKRTFASGDLPVFKDLCRKELIVRTTHENPDALLLRFVVSWGLLAIVVMALSIGFVDSYFARLPSARTTARNTRVTAAAKSEPAQVAQLRGHGIVYLVPLGLKSITLPQLAEDLKQRYGLQSYLLTPVTPPSWAKNASRKQFVAEDLVTAMKLAYQKQAMDPDAVMIGLTDEDMYISDLSWGYAFSFRDEDRFAVISTARLSQGDDDNKPVSAEVLQKRVSKLLRRDLGILYYHLQSSRNYRSILYNQIDDVSDLDDIGDDYLKSDALVRADLHVQEGDPCFVLRHYTEPEREHPESGRVIGCNGYFREPDLETVQIDLRYGLLLDQRTDFLIPDRISLELTRFLRTQDPQRRAFGVGGNHNLNIFLVGDRWPFTWIDLVLEHGGRSHFRRSNWGFGYWDAHYTNRDANGSKFTGSTIEWAWPGWKLKNGNLTYQFPDAARASRPEQSALVGIEDYSGRRIALGRDETGNLLRARSPAGNELMFKYDPDNRVIEIRQRDGKYFEYSYDATGHLARVKDADQRVTDYGYDQAGRLNRVVQDETEICTLTYDSAGRVESETIGGNRTYLFHYSFDFHTLIRRVEISDSAGPIRKVRMSEVDYTVEESAASKK